MNINPFAFWNAILWQVEQRFAAAHPMVLPEPPPASLALPLEDMPPHQVIYGQTRTGKSRFMEHMYDSIAKARVERTSAAGAIAFDVHDSFFRNLEARLALRALDDPEIYDLYVPIDPTNRRWIVRYNPLACTGDQLPEERAGVLAGAIMRVWDDEHTIAVQVGLVLRRAFHTLIEAGLGLEHFKNLLADAAFRENILRQLRNPVLDEYWSGQWYPARPGKEFRDFVSSVVRRIEPLIANRRVAEIFKPPSTIDFRDLLDQGRFVLVNGAKGTLSRETAYLFNALVLEEVVQAFFARLDTAEDARRLVFVFCDEYQNYATDSMEELLTEGGKYKCDLNLATQTVIEDGKNKALQDKVFKSASRIASFRVAGDDADILQAEFTPQEIDQVKWVRQSWQKPFGIDTLYEEPVFRSLDEIEELARRELLKLPNRQYFFKIRGLGETRLLRTPDVPDVRDLPNARHLPMALERLDREAFERFGVPRAAWDRGVRRVFSGLYFDGSLSAKDVPDED